MASITTDSFVDRGMFNSICCCAIQGRSVRQPADTHSVVLSHPPHGPKQRSNHPNKQEEKEKQPQIQGVLLTRLSHFARAKGLSCRSLQAMCYTEDTKLTPLLVEYLQLIPDAQH